MNSEFDAADFLQHDWQQRPRVIRQLFPGFTDAIAPEELAGLACEEYVESRLIRERETGRWSLQHGPFSESDFTRLPNAGWTVLVQAVDQWVPEVAAIRQQFAFIPQWRIEDVMVSYAADGGGVGPHYDYYDVFLLQGSGQRRWRVGPRVAPETPLINQDGVGIMPDFTSVEEFILNPGDALYVPPQFAHWGTSLGASTCYSIGFRAPSVADMLEGYSDDLIAASPADQRYVDSTPQRPRQPGRLDADDLTATFAELQRRFADPTRFQRWFGGYCTRPKYPELREPLEVPLQRDALLQALSGPATLQHNAGSRFIYQSLVDSLVLFVDGEAHDLPAESEMAVALLCVATTTATIGADKLSDHPELSDCIVNLVNQGSLLLV